MVRPHLEYVNTVWWPTLKCQRSELEKVQHRATKLIPELKHLPYEQRLTILNMPTLAFRHLRGTMIDTYKYATHKYKCQLLNFNTTSVTRSNGYKQQMQYSKIPELLHKCTVNAWNSLPTEVVSADTVNICKNLLDNHWKNHPLKFNVTAYPSFQS